MMTFVKVNFRPPQFTSYLLAGKRIIFLWQKGFCFFTCLLCTLPALAEKTEPSNTGGAGTPPPQPTALEQFFPFILLGLFFYFILIRPQQRKAKSHNQFLSNLKRGDEVLTASGIFGSIEGLTDQFVILEVAENVRIRVMKSQIASYTKSLESGEKPK